MTLGEIRRRPTLPGRFQPSTISVLRLNFCVRDGNRWIPQAIVTGIEQGSKPFAAAFLPASGRPPNGLPTSFQLRLRSGASMVSAFAVAWLRSLPLTFPHRWLCASFASAQALALFMPSAPSKLHRLLTSLCPTKTSFRQLFSHILLSLLSASVRALALPFCFLPLLTNPGLDQALDRLVSSSFIRCRTFTDDLSTSSSLRGLTCF